MEANGRQPSPEGNQAPPPPRPRVRPHITLKITPPGPGATTPPLRPLSYYYGSPLVGIPLTPVPLGTDQHGIPISMVHAYPTKASEFMFKQFEGFRDFTMNTAKSGLSLGEKTAFWMYNRMRVLSRRWFTHIFLLIVVGGYCMLGAVMFVAVEGGHERKHLDEIREQRHALLRTIRQRWEQMGPMENQRDEVEWLGGAVQAIREYELHVVDHYKHGIQDRRDKPIWNYWNAVFFCGTTITTIGEFSRHESNERHPGP